MPLFQLQFYHSKTDVKVKEDTFDSLNDVRKYLINKVAWIGQPQYGIKQVKYVMVFDHENVYKGRSRHDPPKYLGTAMMGVEPGDDPKKDGFYVYWVSPDSKVKKVIGNQGGLTAWKVSDSGKLIR